MLNTGLAVAAGIPLATLDVNRGDAASTNLTITINPAVAGPGLVLNGVAGPQGQTLTVAGGNGYAVTFGSNALNSFTGNVTINNAIAMTLNDNPDIASIGGVAPVITKSGAGLLTVGAAVSGLR